MAPFDRRLLSPAVRWALAASAAVGLLATATVVAQAVALGALLAGAMPAPRSGDQAGHWVLDLAVVGGAFAVRGLCALTAEVLGRWAAAEAKADLRGRLVGSALASGAPSASPGSPVTPGPAGVAVLAGRGLDALDVYVGRCLPDLVLAVVAPVALAAAVGVLDWVSGLVVLVVLGLFPVFGSLVGRAAMRLAGERWRQLEVLGRQVADVFAGLPVLKAYGLAPRQRRRIAQAGAALERATLGTLRTAFLSALVLDTLASVSVAVVAVPLGLRLLSGSVHLAAALAVLVVAPEVFVPLRRATAEFHESTEGLAALARVNELTGGESSRTAAVPPETAVRPAAARGARPPGPASATAPVPRPTWRTVALRDVRVWPPGRTVPVLDGASLALEPGETVALVGPNGSGKSTLLSVLLGLIPVTGGTVHVGGRDLASVDPAEWRRHVAFLSEQPTLLAATLADNLRLAEPRATDDQLLAALAAAGVPGGLALADRLGEGGRPVSAGERQRIGLARTLLRRASTYLLDEPTVHLDGRTERAVLAGLRRVLDGRTALVVTHRPAVLGLADRVLTLRDGRITTATS